MAKIIVGIALVAFCGFCGYVLTAKYRKRKEYYRQFFAFNRSFLGEVSSSRRPIAVWLSQSAYTGNFETTARGFLSALQSGDTTLSSMEFPEFLTADERTFAADYFSSLGRSDAEEQKKRLQTAEKNLSEKKDAAEKECAKYCDLYVKMGVLSGLLLLILLI